MTFFETLQQKVVEQSEAKKWEYARKEWIVVDCDEDEEQTEQCICGKENLRYLYTIKNRYNGNILYPIGSTCIQKFESEVMDGDAIIWRAVFHMVDALSVGIVPRFNSEFFTRKLLAALYAKGLFKANKFNRNDGRNDYQFLIDMFNKKDKSSVTAAQQRKIRIVLLQVFEPYRQVAEEVLSRRKKWRK